MGDRTTDVFRAADRLFLSGILPSERKVRAVIGNGSNREISPALQLWRNSCPTRFVLASSVPAVAATPSDGQMVSRVEMEALIADIEARAEGERRHLMMETDRVRQDMAAPLQRKIDKLETENFLLRAKLEALERQRR